MAVEFADVPIMILLFVVIGHSRFVDMGAKCSL